MCKKEINMHWKLFHFQVICTLHSVLLSGEDRWLCTLMLQQGYRVEYCAASDALTYAPEGHNTRILTSC